jgi:hypothetical protein
MEVISISGSEAPALSGLCQRAQVLSLVKIITLLTLPAFLWTEGLHDWRGIWGKMLEGEAKELMEMWRWLIYKTSFPDLNTGKTTWPGLNFALWNLEKCSDRNTSNYEILSF